MAACPEDEGRLFTRVGAPAYTGVRAKSLTDRALTFPDSLFTPYSFIRFVDAKTSDENTFLISDEEMLEKAGKLIFKVDRWNVFTNDTLLHLLERDIIPAINGSGMRLRRMVIRGAASPEGPVENNRMLARRRATTLYDFLRKRLIYPVTNDAFKREEVVEDYQLLCTLMRRNGDADLPIVQQLCDRYLPGKNYQILKKAMQKVQGGRLWKRLLRQYFPELRAARVVLFFEKAPAADITLSTLPDSLQKADLQRPTLDLQPDVPNFAETGGGLFGYEGEPRREILSVKTNLLMDFAYMPGYDRWCPLPNIAIEYYPRAGHFTYGASLDLPWWQHYHEHKFFQVRNWQIESRYYLKPSKPWAPHGPHGFTGGTKKYDGPAFSGLYFQGYINAGVFGICFDANRGWVGEGIGGGVGAGYVLPISRNKHWRLEFQVQAGFFTCKYDPYQYENLINRDYHDDLYYYRWTQKPELFKKRQYRWNWIGPTRIGITLSYDLLYRRNHKRGVSLKSREGRR